MSIGGNGTIPGNSPEVSEHHGRAEDHSGRVGSVGTLDVAGDVTATRLEERVFLQTVPSILLLRMFQLILTRPTLHPGTTPGPPTRAAPMLETMAPYKLGMTMTSNWPGRATSCMELQGGSDGNELGAKEERVAVRVVDNHVVELDAHGLVVLGDAAEGVEEETITELHDVGLVHASNFLHMDQHAAWGRVRTGKGGNTPCVRS